MNVEEKLAAVEEAAQDLCSISDNIVKAYAQELDDLMTDLRRDIIEKEGTDRELEGYLFELGNLIYFLGSKLETVGLKEDISKLLVKECYNNAYLTNRLKDSEQKNKMTVAELTALAENTSKEDSAVNAIYSKVYKQLKYKIDAAYDMVNSIRKIITRRMQEISLSNSFGNRDSISFNSKADEETLPF